MQHLLAAECDTPANLYLWHRKGHRNPLFGLMFYNSLKYTCAGLHFPPWSQFFHVFQPMQGLQTEGIIFWFRTLEVTMAMLQLDCDIFGFWGCLQWSASISGQGVLIICGCGLWFGSILKKSRWFSLQK